MTQFAYKHVTMELGFHLRQFSFINIALCNIFGFRKMQGCLVAEYDKRRLCCICSIVTCLVCHGRNFWVDSCYSHFTTNLSKSFLFPSFCFLFILSHIFLYNVR
ncbi:hypothetical protein ACB092_04G168600 [Castanea dentata]